MIRLRNSRKLAEVPSCDFFTQFFSDTVSLLSPSTDQLALARYYHTKIPSLAINDMKAAIDRGVDISGSSARVSTSINHDGMVFSHHSSNNNNYFPPTLSSASAVTATKTSTGSVLKLAKQRNDIDTSKLAKIIRRGVDYEVKKKKEEKKLGRTINLKEWAEVAGCDSRDIRHGIVAYRDAKRTLVSQNMGLIHACIKSSPFLLKKASYDELLQEGCLGLIRAAELFDESRGFRFSTFATVWIKGVLGNYQRDMIRIPQRTRQEYNRLQRIVRDNGGEISGRRLEKEMGLGRHEIKALSFGVSSAKYPLSMDRSYAAFASSPTSSSTSSSQNEISLGDTIESKTETQFADAIQCKLDVLKLLTDNLSEREQTLIRLRYGLLDGKSRTLSECAKVMGISPERVRTLSKKSLEKLRRAENVGSLMEYLVDIA